MKKCFPYRLYKIHENSDCLSLLSVVRYLHGVHQIDIRPSQIIERRFPSEVKYLPTIEYIINGQPYYLGGLQNIINLFEKYYGIDNLLESAIQWTKDNPNYRVQK